MLPTHPQVAATGSGPSDPRLRDGVLSLNQAAQALGMSVQALAPLLRKEQVQVHSLAIGGAPVSVIALSDLARLRRAVRERDEAAKASEAAAPEIDDTPLWMQVRDAQHNKTRLEGAVQSLRSELNQAREKIAEAEARCESTAKELRIAKHSLERLDQWKRENDGGDTRIKQQREEIEHLRARLSAADGAIKRFELELAGREAEKKELESLRAERVQLLGALERQNGQLEQARARIEDLTKDRDFQGERRAELERKVGALRVAARKGAGAAKRCKALAAELRTSKEVERSRERYADRLEEKLADLQRRLAELRQQSSADGDLVE